MYLDVKALHIIFIVTWFAGLFYIVRLFIYHAETKNMEEPKRSILQDQYKLMSYRLWYIITWPSAIITLILAGILLYLNPAWLTQKWMWIKLVFVFFLYVYHFACHKIYKQLQKDEIKYSSNQLRIWNEVSTIILFAVVFLVVLKNAISWVWGVIGIVLFSVIIMMGIKLYKRIRMRNEEKDIKNQK
ncbi:CopD family protein [Aureivirga sp. CE67]|uniref:CopD family protein n=1 Tax=Aureivirga sp. CE67 TaxID=1788983 RepID=UPI001E2F02E2